MPVAPLPPRSPIEAVIFDMDGLLVDSEPFWRAVTIDFLDALVSDVRLMIDRGLTKGMRVDESLSLFAGLAPWPGAGDPVAEAAVLQSIVAAVVAAIDVGAELMPGALEAIERFRAAGLCLALASGSVPPVIDAVLDRFGLRPSFDAVVSASDLPLGKPHPAIFLHTAEILKVAAESCVVLEDSLNGCIAAKAAKMRVIAVPSREDASDRRFAIADVVLASLESLGDASVSELLGLSLDPPLLR